jgi:hypothetical protein
VVATEAQVVICGGDPSAYASMGCLLNTRGDYFNGPYSFDKTFRELALMSSSGYWWSY